MIYKLIVSCTLGLTFIPLSFAMESNPQQPSSPLHEQLIELVQREEPKPTLEEVKKLLDQGADCEKVSTKIPLAMNAFFLAIWRGHEDIVKLFVEKGANLDSKVMLPDILVSLEEYAKKHPKLANLFQSYQALKKTVLDNSAAQVTELLQQGLCVNARFKEANDRSERISLHRNGFTVTLLHLAAAQDATITEILLNAGADINAKDGNGNVPLCNAVAQTLPLFLARKDKDLDLNSLNSLNQNTLMMQIRGHRYGVVNALVDEKVSLHLPDSNGDTAFTLAVKHGTQDNHGIFIRMITAIKKRNPEFFTSHEDIRRYMNEAAREIYGTRTAHH